MQEAIECYDRVLFRKTYKDIKKLFDSAYMIMFFKNEKDVGSQIVNIDISALK